MFDKNNYTQVWRIDSIYPNRVKEVSSFGFSRVIYERRSLGIFFGPFLGSGLEFGSVALEKLGNLGDEGVIRVGVSEERRNRKQHL